MKLECKWCGETVELTGSSSNELTVCTKCLESIIEAIPKKSHNQCIVTGLGGNRPLPKC